MNPHKLGGYLARRRGCIVLDLEYASLYILDRYDVSSRPGYALHPWIRDSAVVKNTRLKPSEHGFSYFDISAA